MNMPQDNEMIFFTFLLIICSPAFFFSIVSFQNQYTFYTIQTMESDVLKLSLLAVLCGPSAKSSAI